MVTPSGSNIKADLAPEVLALAARLQAQQQDTLTWEDMMAAAAEANIAPEYVHQAARQLQEKPPAKFRRAPWLKGGAIAPAFLLGSIAVAVLLPLLGITLLRGPVGMGCHAMMGSEPSRSLSSQ